MSFSPYSNSLSSLYSHQTEPPPLESTTLEDFSKTTIFSKDHLTTKPKKPPSSEGLLIHSISEDLRTNQSDFEQCTLFTSSLYNSTAGSSPLSDLNSDSNVKSCDEFSSNQENPSQTHNFEVSPDIASDLFTLTDDFSPPEIIVSDLLASDSTEAINTSPSSLTSSNLSTPVVSTTHGTSTGINYVLDDVSLESLLAAPMYDEKDVTDSCNWDPLFLNNSSLSPVASFQSKLVCEKRTAIVFNENDDSETQSPVKKQKHEEAQEEFQNLAKSTNLKISDGSNLPPIIVKDPSDPKAIRRARNTAAARRSRDKKREKMSDLEARVAELERINIQLSIENQILRNMKNMPPRS